MTFRSVNVVIVGDSGVGKTCLLISYSTNAFPGEYIPKIFENFPGSVMVNGKPVYLKLRDTANTGDYIPLRLLEYTKANVVLLCYNTINKTTFDNIRTKWNPEINKYCPKAVKLLVGLKKDLMNDVKKYKEYKTTNKNNKIILNYFLRKSCNKSNTFGFPNELLNIIFLYVNIKNIYSLEKEKLLEKLLETSQIPTSDEINCLAKEIRAYKSIQNSGLTRENLITTFDEAIRGVLEASNTKKKCKIM